MHNSLKFLVLLGLLFNFPDSGQNYSFKRKEDITKCPAVKGARNFDLNGLLGMWYVVQYYATSEEDITYKCMRAVFSTPIDEGGGFEIEMNVTYSFADDPDNDKLAGNITWVIPDVTKPSHWIHAEDTYEGIYNTYIMDSDNDQWGLLLHCAEMPKSPRYLTSIMISRNATLPPSVVSYLRDKLPKYDIALEFMFDMKQTDCEESPKRGPAYYWDQIEEARPKKKSQRNHPIKRRTKTQKPSTKNNSV